MSKRNELKVYLAARYSDKELVKARAAELQDFGVIVTSRWMDEPHSPESGGLGGDTPTEFAFQDREDIDNADWLVLFSVEPTQPMVRGGRHVEFGYALGRNKNMLVIGPKENIFHFLPDVIVIDTWEEGMRFLVNHAAALEHGGTFGNRQSIESNDSKSEGLVGFGKG